VNCVYIILNNIESSRLLSTKRKFPVIYIPEKCDQVIQFDEMEHNVTILSSDQKKLNILDSSISEAHLPPVSTYKTDDCRE
jgi:hypothetical protein